MKAFEHQRKIPASAKEIFKVFADVERLGKWWGPDGFTCTTTSFEFKPEGKWVFVMHGPDGKNYPNEMIFNQIYAPDKLVMRHSVEPYFTLTLTITDVEAGAVVNWHQDFDSEEIARNMAHIVQPANEQNLAKLEAIIWGSGT